MFSTQTQTHKDTHAQKRYGSQLLPLRFPSKSQESINQSIYLSIYLSVSQPAHNDHVCGHHEPMPGGLPGGSKMTTLVVPRNDDHRKGIRINKGYTNIYTHLHTFTYCCRHRFHKIHGQNPSSYLTSIEVTWCPFSSPSPAMKAEINVDSPGCSTILPVRAMVPCLCTERNHEFRAQSHRGNTDRTWNWASQDLQFPQSNDNEIVN